MLYGAEFAGLSRLTSALMRRIYTYILGHPVVPLTKRDTKAKLLDRQGALNRHPERVQASWFQADGFFDARDLVQVKYEMLRHVNTEGAKKAEAAELFGLSRPTYYQAEAAFAQQGLAGLLPQRRGPRSPHKLTAEVMTFIETKMMDEHPPAARALAQAIRTELGLSIHPRSIERALARKKKR